MTMSTRSSPSASAASRLRASPRGRKIPRARTSSPRTAAQPRWRARRRSARACARSRSSVLLQRRSSGSEVATPRTAPTYACLQAHVRSRCGELVGVRCGTTPGLAGVGSVVAPHAPRARRGASCITTTGAPNSEIRARGLSRPVARARAHHSVRRPRAADVAPPTARSSPGARPAVPSRSRAVLQDVYDDNDRPSAQVSVMVER